MSTGPAYSDYHPRWLRRQVSTWWWLQRWSYFLFILREISSVFVAWTVVYLLMLIRAVGQGDAAYRAFTAWSATPMVLAVNLVTLALVVFHAVTWFNLASTAMVVHAGRRRVPGSLITGSNYAAWVAVSALIAWLVLGA
jgi:fumarate reductase subunit C